MTQTLASGVARQFQAVRTARLALCSGFLSFPGGTCNRLGQSKSRLGGPFCRSSFPINPDPVYRTVPPVRRKNWASCPRLSQPNTTRQPTPLKPLARLSIYQPCSGPVRIMVHLYRQTLKTVPAQQLPGSSPPPSGPPPILDPPDPIRPNHPLNILGNRRVYELKGVEPRDLFNQTSRSEDGLRAYRAKP